MSDKHLLDTVLGIKEPEALSESTETPDEEIQAIVAPLANELKLIRSDNIRLFIEYILYNANEAFWTAPASLITETHPPDEYEPGGNILHTQRVVRTCTFLAMAHDVDPQDYDILISAALLHDCTKMASTDDPENPYVQDAMHPYTVDWLVAKCMAEKSVTTLNLAINIPPDALERILRIVRCSHGIWSPIPETLPSAPLESILHVSDYLASVLHDIIDGDVIKENRWKND